MSIMLNTLSKEVVVVDEQNNRLASWLHGTTAEVIYEASESLPPLVRGNSSIPCHVPSAPVAVRGLPSDRRDIDIIVSAEVALAMRQLGIMRSGYVYSPMPEADIDWSQIKTHGFLVHRDLTR